jgi:chemotaxis protein methyltransferase WspC
MAMNTVEKWLSEVIGLDAQSLGPQAVANAVKRRMAACGLTKESDYLARLRTALAKSSAPAESSAPDELLALIEMIVVPETWFFRDREPFVFLAQYVSTTWLAAHPHDLLQVLSVPCSSGEEPYSIAMTLQSAGLRPVPTTRLAPPTRPARYRIDAVDINPALLRKAAKGVYGPNSFRSGLLAHCERYFKLEGAARIVSPEARAGIRFVRANIMGSAEFAAEQTYDVIFCRNLLIYQHAEARGQIVATLDRLLKPAGLLFVGHAEMMSLLTDRYAPVHHSGAFAYCKIKTRPG